MLDQRWKVVLCLAIAALMANGCLGPHPGDSAHPDDRYGRGCPIPYGSEDPEGPTDGTFLEIYAPHKYPEGRRDAVMLSVRAWNPSASPASLTFAGSRLISLDARIWYQLLFECDEAGNGKFTLKEEDSQVAIENPTVGPEQLRRAKGRLIDGYRFPGMTIHEAGKNKLDFGMRVNGWSLPVTISQP